MEAQGSLMPNQDKSKDLNMGLTNGTTSGNVFVKGYKHGDPKAFPKPTGGSFAAVGAGVTVNKSAGGAGVQAAHIPSFGKQVTASAHANLRSRDDHKVTAHVFHTNNVPKHGPNFTTHGGGVKYEYKDKVGLEASTAHTPIAKRNEHSIGGHATLHSTPTSSLKVNAGVSQTTSPFGNTRWHPGGGLTFSKHF